MNIFYLLSKPNDKPEIHYVGLLSLLKQQIIKKYNKMHEIVNCACLFSDTRHTILYYFVCFFMKCCPQWQESNTSRNSSITSKTCFWNFRQNRIILARNSWNVVHQVTEVRGQSQVVSVLAEAAVLCKAWGSWRMWVRVPIGSNKPNETWKFTFWLFNLLYDKWPKILNVLILRLKIKKTW